MHTRQHDVGLESSFKAGAGFNDVTLGPIDVASKGFLNGTYQQFDYGTDFPWGLQMGNDLNYAGVLSLLRLLDTRSQITDQKCSLGVRYD